MNGNTDQRQTSQQQTSADDQDRFEKHGSSDLALIVYFFLAAFAYVFAAMSGTV